MLIDWFTVAAQALNFVVLVWLLKRVLYKPILDAIDARERRIAAELADARAKQADAQKERDEFEQKNEEFDRQRASLTKQAHDEARAERQRLLDEARTAAAALRAKRLDTLREEAATLNQAISRRTQQEVFAIARNTLAALAATSLEERVGEVFTRRLREIDAPTKERFARALKTESESALVRSAFDLPEALRTSIRAALNETFAADIELRFETAPDLVSGIELTAAGQKIAWSIANYLAAMEKNVGALLETEATAKPAPQAPPGAATGVG